jgi:hypothetical protein
MGYLTENDRWLFRYLEKTKSGGITIAQAGMMLYPGDVNGYQYLRKRMKILHDRKQLQYITSDVTNEYIYYKDLKDGKKKPNNHDVLVNNFIAQLYFYNCNIIQYTEKQYWLDNKVISDAFVVYGFGNKYKAALIEMDLNHPTDIGKYERLFEDGCLQKQLGNFPYVVIMSPVCRNQSSDNFEVVHLDTKCTGFANKILTL